MRRISAVTVTVVGADHLGGGSFSDRHPFIPGVELVAGEATTQEVIDSWSVIGTAIGSTAFALAAVVHVVAA